jgi:DNA polymerase V
MMVMRAQGAIGHLDADCFYVSAERVRNFLLRENPVGVLGNQGACVIAKSYEMKATGVKTGIPIWDALKLCPNGIYVKRDFRWYEVLSRLMLECVRDFSPKIEYYSIDEFFFEVVPFRGKTLQETAAAIRDRIWEEVHVPVTVGIARTKTLAKLISDSAKPFGASAVLDDVAVASLLAGQPVTEISGIAGRRARTLAPWGIRTCLDLARADRRLVRELLTASGELLWWELNGDPSSAVLTERPLHKVLFRGGSFGEKTSSPIMLWGWLVRNLERLIEELEYHRLCAGKLTVWVAYANGQTGSGHTSLTVPSQRFDVLLEALRPCLRRSWVPHVAAMRMHLFAEKLVFRDSVQLGFFEKSGGKTESLARVKHEINKKHGRFILRSAATLPLLSIYRDEANEFDICDIRGKMCF